MRSVFLSRPTMVLDVSSDESESEDMDSHEISVTDFN